MNDKNNIEKFQNLMFDDISTITGLSETDKKKLLRYRFAFTQLLESPSMEDTVLRDQLMSQFGIEKTQAYRDISNLKVILPNIRNAGKEWIRFIVNEELKAAIKDARDAGKIKERILAISALAKYNKLDQDEAEQMPWDEIIPVPIEPTSDPTVLGIKPMPNKHEVIAKLYEKYRDEIEIEDIDFENAPDDSDSQTDLL